MKKEVKRLHIKLTDELHDDLNMFCRDHDINKSEWVRNAIKIALMRDKINFTPRVDIDAVYKK